MRVNTRVKKEGGRARMGRRRGDEEREREWDEEKEVKKSSIVFFFLIAAVTPHTGKCDTASLDAWTKNIFSFFLSFWRHSYKKIRTLSNKPLHLCCPSVFLPVQNTHKDSHTLAHALHVFPFLLFFLGGLG